LTNVVRFLSAPAICKIVDIFEFICRQNNPQSCNVTFITDAAMNNCCRDKTLTHELMFFLLIRARYLIAVLQKPALIKFFEARNFY